jgi:hypothetical protein
MKEDEIPNHVARMDRLEIFKIFLLENLKRRALVRPRLRWEHDIRMGHTDKEWEVGDCIHLGYGPIEALLNTVLNIQGIF